MSTLDAACRVVDTFDMKHMDDGTVVILSLIAEKDSEVPWQLPVTHVADDLRVSAAYVRVRLVALSQCGLIRSTNMRPSGYQLSARGRKMINDAASTRPLGPRRIRDCVVQ